MSTKINHLISAIVMIAFLIIGIASGDGSKSGNANGDVKGDSIEIASSEVKSVPIGEPLHTQYFDVTVNGVGSFGSIKFSEYSKLSEEKGMSYLILNTTFKNTDNESRMIMDGVILINYNGKEYKFDHSETVMEEGWGTLLDQINPLTSKTTNLVYKLPSEITGPAYYRPGRANANSLISLGNIETIDDNKSFLKFLK